MSAFPIHLERLGETQLRIEWSDGERRDYTIRELRDGCPCATCREKKKQQPTPANVLTVLSPAEARPLRLQGMKPVGNYAYQLAFSDGHDSGIYTFALLRELGKAV